MEVGRDVDSTLAVEMNLAATRHKMGSKQVIHLFNNVYLTPTMSQALRSALRYKDNKTFEKLARMGVGRKLSVA